MLLLDPNPPTRLVVFLLRITMHCGSTRFARLPYVLGSFVTPLAEQRKRMRRQGLALRVTRRFHLVTMLRSIQASVMRM
jgi:hypothetical protein